ncbi:MAG: phosphoribosyltransferase [Prochloraceae cyanobacterium]|nr:phosphoribosyltransferase [Prochloraceae cyanobacterium]
MKTIFSNRTEAGVLLAKKLQPIYLDRADLIVLGLPRGGVPIAYQVAKVLHAPLDICLVRKLGVPGHQELAMGAIASGGIMILNEDLVRSLKISSKAIEGVINKEQKELKRREIQYRGDRAAPNLRDRSVILIDDGIATGSTIQAALSSIKKQRPELIVVAVPVAAPDICKELKKEVDEVICLITPEWLYSISLWYEDFSPTSDEEVRYFLAKSRQELTATGC